MVLQNQRRRYHEDIIFMQDGAPPQTDRHIKQFLRQHFINDQLSYSKDMASIFVKDNALRLLKGCRLSGALITGKI